MHFPPLHSRLLPDVSLASHSTNFIAVTGVNYPYTLALMFFGREVSFLGLHMVKSVKIVFKLCLNQFLLIGKH